MNFASHDKAGFWCSVITGAAGYLFRTPETALLAGALCFIGSLAPDLDTDSIPSRWAARGGLILSAICLYTKVYLPAVIAGLVFFALKSFPHRSFTHSYFWPLALIAVGIYEQSFLYPAFAIGLICHLILDGVGPARNRP